MNNGTLHIFIKTFLSLATSIFLLTAAQAEEPSAKTTTEIYQDWQYSCVERNKTTTCEVVQSAVNNQGGVVSQLSAVINPDGNPQIQIILPHFIHLQKEIAMEVPDQLKLSVQPLFCDPRACYVIQSEQKVLNALKEGDKLDLEVDLISGEKLGVSYSLLGFNAAFNRLSGE